jgi:spore coat protein U-like protein
MRKRRAATRTAATLLAALVPSAGFATPTTTAKLEATLTVTSLCSITKVAPLDFPSLTAASLGADVGHGSITYACAGAVPLLSASDTGASTSSDFTLRGSGGSILFTLCAELVERPCQTLKNGDGSAVAIPESGTEVIHGAIIRPAGQKFAAGNYADAITVTLTF